MSDNVAIIPYRVRYKGELNLHGMIKMAKDWFVNRGYEFHEKFHKHKELPSGEQIRYKWDCWRKEDEYYNQSNVIVLCIIYEIIFLALNIL